MSWSTTRAAVSAVLLLLTALPGSAHNGSQATAIPITGITIDGELSDWPDDLSRYPVTRAVVGEPPTGAEDFRASFRVAYSAEENALYVAIEVSDDVVVVDTGDPPDWNTEDYGSVYLDLGHGTLQYRSRISPGERNLTISSQRYPEAHEEAVVVASHGSGKHVYESRTDVGKISQGEVKLGPGMVVGFDVGITDLDDESSFSWLAWGTPPLKHERADNVGDLLLLGEPDAVGTVHGWVTDRDSGAPLTEVVVQAENPTRGLRVEVITDSEGVYFMHLPQASYTVSAPGAAESQRPHLALEAGTRRSCSIQAIVATVELPEKPTYQRFNVDGTEPWKTPTPRWPYAVLIACLAGASIVGTAVLVRRRQYLGQLLVAPGAAMARVAESPDWAVPVSAVLTGVLVVSIPVSAKLAVQFGAMGSSHLAILGGLILMPAIAIMVGLIFALGSWVLRAGGLWALSRVFGGKVPFKAMLAVAGYALMPEVLFAAVVLAVSAHFGELSAGTLWSHGWVSLVRLLPDVARSSAGMGSLLAEIDLFSIWSLILSVIGVQRLCHWPGEKASLVVVAYWLVAVAAVVGVSAGAEMLQAMGGHP